jgi:hypothetical protein
MKHIARQDVFRGLSGGLLVLSLLSSISVHAEAGQGAALEVVNSYLESLATGDVPQINSLLGDTMKQSNRQLLLNPGYYGEFLRTHYAGVTMTVESVRDKGEVVEARVRFDYPTSQSTTNTFVLGQVEGAWKITDEIY